MHWYQKGFLFITFFYFLNPHFPMCLISEKLFQDTKHGEEFQLADNDISIEKLPEEKLLVQPSSMGEGQEENHSKDMKIPHDDLHAEHKKEEALSPDENSHLEISPEADKKETKLPDEPDKVELTVAVSKEKLQELEPTMEGMVINEEEAPKIAAEIKTSQGEEIKETPTDSIHAELQPTVSSPHSESASQLEETSSPLTIILKSDEEKEITILREKDDKAVLSDDQQAALSNVELQEADSQPIESSSQLLDEKQSSFPDFKEDKAESAEVDTSKESIIDEDEKQDLKVMPSEFGVESLLVESKSNEKPESSAVDEELSMGEQDKGNGESESDKKCPPSDVGLVIEQPDIHSVQDSPSLYSLTHTVLSPVEDTPKDILNLEIRAKEGELSPGNVFVESDKKEEIIDTKGEESLVDL